MHISDTGQLSSGLTELTPCVHEAKAPPGHGDQVRLADLTVHGRSSSFWQHNHLIDH
jgi:hypothetical protein